MDSRGRALSFYSLCPAGAEEKNTRIWGDPESEKTLVSRIKSLAIFYRRRRVPRKFYRIFGGQKKRLKIFFPKVKWLEEKHANGRKRSSLAENRKRFSTGDAGSRRKPLAIFDGRRRVLRKFMEFSGDREEKMRRTSKFEEFGRLRRVSSTCIFFFLERHAPANPFIRFARRAGSPPIPGPLRFQRNLRGRPFFRFRVPSDSKGI